MKRLLFRKLARDRKGTTMMEFGLIAPVVMTMLLGTLDAGFQMYMRSVVDGAMQKVARDSALEGAAVIAQQELVDAKVEELIHEVHSTAQIETTRRYYKTFSDASDAKKEEIINDANANGNCDPGERFWDSNENGTWDKDGAADGQGGAKDVVIITIKVSYPRLFPMAGLIGMSEIVKMEGKTVLANQPYGEQDQYGARVNRGC